MWIETYVDMNKYILAMLVVIPTSILLQKFADNGTEISLDVSILEFAGATAVLPTSESH